MVIKTMDYYKLEELTNRLKQALKETREEQGLSIRDTANVIKKVYAKEEVEVLINELKK